jgi:hypothetical protein
LLPIIPDPNRNPLPTAQYQGFSIEAEVIPHKGGKGFKLTDASIITLADYYEKFSSYCEKTQLEWATRPPRDVKQHLETFIYPTDFSTIEQGIEDEEFGQSGFGELFPPKSEEVQRKVIELMGLTDYYWTDRSIYPTGASTIEEGVEDEEAGQKGFGELLGGKSEGLQN